jgi:hypothetical protein
MHSANFTAFSCLVSFLSAPLLVSSVLLVPVLLVLLVVSVLLAVPVSEDAFEPQPALIRPIRPASARATNGRNFPVMFAPDVWGVAL